MVTIQFSICIFASFDSFADFLLPLFFKLPFFTFSFLLSVIVFNYFCARGFLFSSLSFFLSFLFLNMLSFFSSFMSFYIYLLCPISFYLSTFLFLLSFPSSFCLYWNISSFITIPYFLHLLVSSLPVRLTMADSVHSRLNSQTFLSFFLP